MIIYFNQADPRWGKKIYSAIAPHTETIAESGCGPTSAAMVVTSLTPFKITPDRMAEFSVENGFRLDGTGTAFGLFYAVASKYSMKCTQTGIIAKAIECVKSGGMAICSTNGGQNGLFSSGGHLFVMAESDGNNISFLDPGDYKGKYEKSFRKPYVKRDGNYVVVKKDVADKHIFTYFLFTKIEVVEVQEAADPAVAEAKRIAEEVASLVSIDNVDGLAQSLLNLKDTPCKWAVVKLLKHIKG